MPLVPFFVHVSTFTTWFLGAMVWAGFLGWMFAEAQVPAKSSSRKGLLFLPIYTILFLIFGLYLLLAALGVLVLAVLLFAAWVTVKMFWKVTITALPERKRVREQA